ncbi:MAG: DUF1127 domain-containing protein [Planktotalea sp.]|uniref:DUF1127 domain-containing protein n=1 Tax=Planktotalea sp. TaxID=2029877 RepID=UPI003C77609F
MTQSITRNVALNCAPTARPISPLAKIFHMIRVARSRRALAQLSAEQLCDIGLTRQAAKREATRPFWDAPTTWMK